MNFENNAGLSQSSTRPHTKGARTPREALTPPKSKKSKTQKTASRSGAVWHAIFAELGLPEEFHNLLLFFAGYANNAPKFEAYRGEIAGAYYAETGAAGSPADKTRETKAREQRFHRLLDDFSRWQTERGLGLVRYYPGSKVDGESQRGAYHVPILKLFAEIYNQSKSTSAFEYAREAKIRKVAREVLRTECRDWNAPQLKTSRSLPRAERVARERKKILSRLKSVTADMTRTEREAFWAEILGVGEGFFVTLIDKNKDLALYDLSSELDPEVYKKSVPVVENKPLIPQLGDHSSALRATPNIGQPLQDFIRDNQPRARQEYESERVLAAYEASYSLADVEACNTRKPKGAGAWKQYAACPACGTGNEKRGRFNVHPHGGGYRCHACGITGRLREFWDNPPIERDGTRRLITSNDDFQAKREAQAQQERAEQAARIEAARNLYESAKPLAQSPAARDYVQRRTGAADVAERCGVRFTKYAGTEHEGKNRHAVVVALHDADGRIVATNDRQINNAWNLKTFTTGAKDQGVFTTPGALEAARVLIVESPLDAMAVHACGFDAIALCGTSWPAWLPDALEGKDVLLGLDNDQPDKRGQRAGDVSATKLAQELVGRAFVQRVRPSLKDWAEIAETRGLDGLRAELAAALFDASATSDDGEWEEVAA